MFEVGEEVKQMPNSRYKNTSKMDKINIRRDGNIKTKSRRGNINVQKLNRKNSKATCEKVKLRFIVHICYKNKVF